VAVPTDVCTGIEAAGEGDADLLACWKMFEDGGHVSILSDEWGRQVKGVKRVKE